MYSTHGIVGVKRYIKLTRDNAGGGGGGGRGECLV